MTARLMRFMSALILGGTLVVAGCGGNQEADVQPDTTAAVTDMPETATAELQPTQGNNVTGTVTFTSRNGTARVQADVMNLSPGEHGFHIHQFGDCSAPDASSAGGHFNPQNQNHGAPEDSVRHVGDLGNLRAGQDSTATYSRMDSLISLTGRNSIVGKSVIVHANADDLESQPSGNAGRRVACGVIERMGTQGMMPGETDTTARSPNTEI